MDEEALYTPRTRWVLTRAHEFALERGAARVGVEHLMLAILDDGDLVATAAITNVTSLGKVAAELTRLLDSEPHATPIRAPQN